MNLIQIKHRFTGAVLFEKDCDSIRICLEAGVETHANLYGANLRGADLRGADLRGADLRGADLCGADLCGANLCGADLCGANLRGADLCGANLRGANLRGADLYGANLRGADLYGADLIDAGQDIRGYRFIAQKNGNGMNVMAGCRYFESLAAARAHWESRHEDVPSLRAECLSKLDLIEATAKARDWVAAKQQAA